ncbi:MAG: GNAT family N-acetyltransferase [Coriobacteriia bacterium]|nr:GNAT family N-acetyltransferase [Coriobacteriia bacterium]
MMNDQETRYFELSMESLRAIGAWAADCAERALPIFETHDDSDGRPRAAIAGIREFAAGGRRSAHLRTLAMAAHAAAREIDDPAPAAAARAAGLAAASAYTHPLADVHQTKHIVGAAAYAALAHELAHIGAPGAADSEVRRAVESAPPQAREVLLHMPARSRGRGRIDALMYDVDSGIRGLSPGIGRDSALQLTIRTATHDDAEPLRRYAERLFTEDLPGIFRRPIPTLDEERAFISAHLASARSTLLLAEVEGTVVGLVDLIGGSLPDESHVGTFGLSVDRDWRARGVGGALLDALVDWAATAGVSRIQGYVWATNPRALALYERHGFEREGLLKRAIIRDGTPIDVWSIARLLDS